MDDLGIPINRNTEFRYKAQIIVTILANITLANIKYYWSMSCEIMVLTTFIISKILHN